MRCEHNRDGAVKYLTDLKGPLDGCRFEALYFPDDGELLLEIDDGRTKKPIGRVKLTVERKRTELGEDFFLIYPVDQTVEKETLYLADGELELGPADYQGELMHLGAWWLTKMYLPTVSIKGEIVYDSRQGQVAQSMESLIGDSRMEAFYDGREVALEGGLTLQTRLEEREMKLSGQEYWQVEVAINDEDDDLAWIEGLVYDVTGTSRNKLFKLVISKWQNVYEPYDFTADLLAFQIRLLEQRLGGPVVVMADEQVYTMNAEAVAERTYFWLGF